MYIHVYIWGSQHPFTTFVIAFQFFSDFLTGFSMLLKHAYQLLDIVVLTDNEEQTKRWMRVLIHVCLQSA